MTDIRTETVPLVDGSALRLTVAEPVSAIRGGIVVLHEARGVTDAVRGLVHGLAGDGWLAVAPHLYHRDGADELDGDADDARSRSRSTGSTASRSWPTPTPRSAGWPTTTSAPTGWA